MSDASDAASFEAPPDLQAFAARLIRARRHRGVGPRCERARHAGEAIDRFAAAREYSTTLAARLDPRWAAPELDRDEIPESVIKAMRRCQKPFHLWNVERVEHDASFRFERHDGLRVGRAAALPEELRVPRQVTKASRVLRDWIEDQAFREAMLKMDRRRFERLLREPLPFGRKDDDPGDDADVVVIAPPGPGGGPRGLPERIAPFVRRPGPRPLPAPSVDDDRDRAGGFDLSQPDDDDEGGGGFGGFDLSQPDDDDEGGGGFGGLDLSQPDDDEGGGGFGGFDLSQPEDDEGGGGFGGFDLSQPDDE